MESTTKPAWEKHRKAKITPTELRQGVVEYWFLKDGTIKFGPSPNAVFYTKARESQTAIDKFWKHKHANTL